MIILVECPMAGDDLAAHDLPFHMGIRIILIGAVVPALNPAYLAEKRGLRATMSNTIETASSGCRMSNV